MTTYEQKMKEREDVREMAEKRIPYVIIIAVCLGLLLWFCYGCHQPSIHNYLMDKSGNPKPGCGWWV